MKKILKVLALLVGLLAFTACESEGPAEKAGEKIDETMEKAAEQVEEAGDEVEKAADDLKEKTE
jgi:predicted small lipoprotein YifL